MTDDLQIRYVYDRCIRVPQECSTIHDALIEASKIKTKILLESGIYKEDIILNNDCIIEGKNSTLSGNITIQGCSSIIANLNITGMITITSSNLSMKGISLLNNIYSRDSTLYFLNVDIDSVLSNRLINTKCRCINSNISISDNDGIVIEVLDRSFIYLRECETVGRYLIDGVSVLDSSFTHFISLGELSFFNVGIGSLLQCSLCYFSGSDAPRSIKDGPGNSIRGGCISTCNAKSFDGGDNEINTEV